MYRNILIATDGSELANKAVEHGLKLAKITGAGVTFVTVTEMWSALAMADEAGAGISNPLQDYEEMAANSAKKILAGATASAKASGIESQTVHVRDSPPAEGIAETAKEKNCDLIVMASHGRRGLRRLVLGSQTTEVLAITKVPVLVVR